jgi:hypothetical protein
MMNRFAQIGFSLCILGCFNLKTAVSFATPWVLVLLLQQAWDALAHHNNSQSRSCLNIVERYQRRNVFLHRQHAAS